MDRLRVLAGALVITALIAGAAVLVRRHYHDGFTRDDTPLFATDEMGLSSAYKTLREAGKKIAVEQSDREPERRYAWWIMQPHLDWFTPVHAQALRRFVESGGVAVLVPEESVIQIGETAQQEELSGFFSALDLDLQIVAFEPPAEDEDGDEDDTQAVAPDAEDEGAEPEVSSITLPVSGSGEKFGRLAEVATSWGNYFDGESLLKAEIRVHSDGFPLVAEFAMGKGSLVVIAESTYFENEFLDRSQNRSLLLALADTYGQDGIVLHQPPDESYSANTK